MSRLTTKFHSMRVVPNAISGKLRLSGFAFFEILTIVEKMSPNGVVCW